MNKTTFTFQISCHKINNQSLELANVSSKSKCKLEFFLWSEWKLLAQSIHQTNVCFPVFSDVSNSFLFWSVTHYFQYVLDMRDTFKSSFFFFKFGFFLTSVHSLFFLWRVILTEIFISDIFKTLLSAEIKIKRRNRDFYANAPLFDLGECIHLSSQCNNPSPYAGILPTSITNIHFTPSLLNPQMFLYPRCLICRKNLKIIKLCDKWCDPNYLILAVVAVWTRELHRTVRFGHCKCQDLCRITACFP